MRHRAVRLPVRRWNRTTIPVLTEAEVTSLAPKVRSVRADRARITLRVGQSMEFSGFSVIAVDSAGRDRGRLIGFDFGIKPGEPADAVPRRLIGKRPGERIPSSTIRETRGRAGPILAEVKVHIIVK